MPPALSALRRYAVPVLAATALLVTVTTAPAPAERARAAAGKATIVGKVKVPPGSFTGYFVPTAYVARLDRPGAIEPVALSSRGAFKAQVTPGLYSVVTSGYAAKRPKDRLSVVSARAGRKVRVKGDRAPARRAGTVRVSVGRFTPPPGGDLDASYFAKGLADLTITDLVNTVHDQDACAKDVRVYEDRKYGRYQEVLKELKLQTTRFFDSQTRAQARKALANLPRLAPTLRVMGRLDSVSETGASGQVRLVHVKSGRVVWSKDISNASPFDLSVDASEAVARFLCEAEVETVPETLSGTFSGSVVTANATLTWSGSLTKSFVANDPHTGFPYLDSAHYRTTAATVTWQLTGRCNGGGALGLGDLSTDFYDSTIEWSETAGKGWGYQLGLAPRSGTTAMSAPCPPDEDGNPMPPYNAATLVGGGGGGGSLLYNSDIRGAETNRYSPDLAAFRGTLAINPGFAQTWTWDLAGSGEVPIP